KGIGLDPEFAHKRLALSDTPPPQMTSTKQRDLERGNRIEVKWLSGPVATLRRELGIETPANRTVHATPKLHAGRAAPTRPTQDRVGCERRCAQRCANRIDSVMRGTTSNAPLSAMRNDCAMCATARDAPLSAMRLRTACTRRIRRSRRRR